MENVPFLEEFVTPEDRIAVELKMLANC